MTPAIRAAEKAGVAFRLHEYAHDPAAESFALEAAAKLGVDPRRVFKTLVARVDGKVLAVGVVPAAARLDLKALAAAVGGKRADMADPAAAEKATGYVVGGISPVGGRRPLPTAVDDSCRQFDTIYVSAGRRGLEMELAPADLVRLARAAVAPIAAGERPADPAPPA